ncbi:hypothetical protein PVAP13_6NG357801 [Panicum virgatum]|uniref:Uncharacterized protein n=1 Tax=Panicum virgatum TaxID=38727 RepID=A0A8T0R621_PANVG|nr:hypothetical protein PVAP13_6NG357801 [Panicum virgatum]
MAAPNHHADEPPASAPASPTAGPGAAPDQDPTGQLTALFAGTTLGVPDHIDLQPPAPAPGHDPAAASSYIHGDGLSRVLAAVLAKAPPPPALMKHLFQPPPAHVPAVQHRRRRDVIDEIVAKLAGGAKPGSPALALYDPAVVRTARALPAAGYGPSPLGRGISEFGSRFVSLSEFEPARGHAARRREARRLSKLPTYYLHAGQESRDRRRRRGMVRRCVRTLLSLHEDRRNERVLSAMMTRLATMESPAGDVPAAPGDASSAEHAQLAELIEKMELSFKD